MRKLSRRNKFWIILAFVVIVGVSVFSFSQAQVVSTFPTTTKNPMPVVTKLPSMKIPVEKIESQSEKFRHNLFVSDIHGRFDTLKKALSEADFTKSDRLFVLGDVIDRGPEGFHALLWLTYILPAEGYHIVVLQGNHEDMWAQMASKGTTDAERLSMLEGSLMIYEDQVPNGWDASLKEWKKLTAGQRNFLLKEMLTGFGQPRLLVTKIGNKWLSLSHTANFTKDYAEQTAQDLGWYNMMKPTDQTYQKDLSKKLGVPESDLQVLIGHIGGRRFGVNPHYIDLDDTNTMNFNASPPVKVYCFENQKFYTG